MNEKIFSSQMKSKYDLCSFILLYNYLKILFPITQICMKQNKSSIKEIRGCFNQFVNLVGMGGTRDDEGQTNQFVNFLSLSSLRTKQKEIVFLSLLYPSPFLSFPFLSLPLFFSKHSISDMFGVLLYWSNDFSYSIII